MTSKVIKGVVDGFASCVSYSNRRYFVESLSPLPIHNPSPIHGSMTVSIFL